MGEICGASIVLKIKICHQILLRMGIGGGSNTNVELLTLWGLSSSHRKEVFFNLNIFLYSRVVIDQEARTFELDVLQLDHWVVRIRDTIDCFYAISFSHIFWELNGKVGHLSKKAIGTMDGFNHFEEYIADLIIDSIYFYVFQQVDSPIFVMF